MNCFEIVTKRNRKGNVVESIRANFDSKEVKGGKTIITEQYGKVINWDFKNMTATWWWVGCPTVGTVTDIIPRN